MGFLNDYNNRRNKRKDEEEERQRDSVSSFGKRVGREEKTGSSFMSQLGNVSKDVFRTETPSTNPYDIALETARNYSTPLGSYGVNKDLLTRNNNVDTGFMERPSVFEQTGYSDEQLKQMEDDLRVQRRDIAMGMTRNNIAPIENNNEDNIIPFEDYLKGNLEDDLLSRSNLNILQDRQKTYDNDLDNYGVNKDLLDLNSRQNQLDVSQDLQNKLLTPEEANEKLNETDSQLDWVKDAQERNYYNAMQDADDYAENSVYQKVNKPLGNYSDAEWASYALNEIRGNQDAGPNIMRDLGEYKFATSDEVDLFNYIYNTQGEDAAMEYYKKLDLPGRMTGQYTDYAAQTAEAHPVLASVESLVASPIKGVGYVGSLIDALSGKELDPNAWYNLPSNLQNAVRSQVSNDIINNANNEFMGKVGSFMYQTGMSMGDFLMNMGLGNENLILGVMGASAASDSVIEAKKRGLSDGQALATGTIAGLAEIVSERVSIEALFNSDAQGIRYIIQNALAEGGEEVESDVINDIADIIINGDKALMRQAYQQYLDAGMSESEAFGKVIGDTALQYSLDFAGGAISGAAMSSVGSVGQYVNQSSIGKTMLSSQDNLDQFVNLGMQSENADTRALAETVAKGDAKKNIIGQLVQKVSYENNLYGNLVNNLRESGETQGMAEAEAEAVMRHITGEELNAQDQEYLNKENVQNALNDVFGGAYDTSYANSETAYDAYDRALEMARQQRAEKMAPVTNAINNVRNIIGNNRSGVQNNTETENNAQVSEDNTQKAEETESQEAVKNMPLSERAKIGAEYSKFRTEVKPVQATLNDVKAVEVTPDGLSVTLNDGQKVNPHQITDRPTQALLSFAGSVFGDTQGAEDFIKAYNENVNVNVMWNAARDMILAGRNGADIKTAVEKIQNDASFKANGKGISVGFLNDMYAYGVREQKNISAKMNSEIQKAGTDLVAKGLGIEGLIKEGGIKEQGSFNESTNEITFGEDTSQSRIETLAHETTHMMKKHARDTYNELEKVVLDSFKDNGTYQKFYDHVKELYGEEASKELIHEEMIARAMQEMLFNENVINELCKEQPSLAKRILAAIRKAIEELRAVFHGKIGTAESHQLSQDIEALEKAEKLYAKGLKEAAASVKVNGGKNTLTEKKSLKDMNDTQLETDYNQALKDENMDLAAQIVEQYAANKGFTQRVYHGTPRFGFTKLDTSFSDDKLTFFTTDKPSVASSYSGNTLIRDVGEINKYSDEQLKELVGDFEKIDANDIDKKYDYIKTVAEAFKKDVLLEKEFLRDDYGKYLDFANEILEQINNHNVDTDILKTINTLAEKGEEDPEWGSYGIRDIYEHANKLKTVVNKLIANNVDGYIIKPSDNFYTKNEFGYFLNRTDSGIYSLYANTDNMLEVDAEGNNWASIFYKGEKYTTRQLARVAAEEGYAGVIIKNVYDNGGRIYVENEDTMASNLYVFFNPQERCKSADVVTYDDKGKVIPLSERFEKNNNDIRYSLKDNTGAELSEGQREYFANVDDELKDENGNLKRYYHGTETPGFSVFKPSNRKGFTDNYNAIYLTDNENVAKTYTNKKDGVYPLYVKAENPYVVDAKGQTFHNWKVDNYAKKYTDIQLEASSEGHRFAYWHEDGDRKRSYGDFTIEELVDKFGEKIGIFDFADDTHIGVIYLDENGNNIPTSTDDCILHAKNNGYDSVVFNNIRDMGRFAEDYDTSQVVAVFNPNQVKDVNNLNPTKNEDIRYSIKDNNGRLLSEGQIEYFKDSKVRDEQGRLIELYHGTGAEFTIFDLNEARDTEDIEAFFFSGNKEEAEGYGNIRKFYLNLKNPADYDTAYDIFFSFKGQVGAGAKTREELIKRGYDGVIAYDEDSPEYTEYLAFYPEQIKLTSNLNPTENEDIRYSLQDDWDFDWEAAMAESEEEKIAEGMVAQNDVNILEDGFRALKDIKDAGKVNISHNKAVQIAKRYTEKYDSATGAESLATSIEAVFAYIREHDVSYDDMLRVMRDVTLPVVENIRGDEQFTEEYRDFVKSLKGTSISLNESQKKEVAYAYGSMANFRKAVAGRFNIKEDGVNIDSLWPEIVEQSGYRLDEEENSNSQPIALLELLDQMKSDKGTVNRGMSDNQLALDMALNIYTDCFKEMSMNAAKVNETEVARRLADTKEILKDTVAKYEDAVDKMYKQMLADTKARAQAEIDRLTQELRELNNIDSYNRSIDTDKRIVQLKRQIDRLKQQQEEDRVYRKTSRQKARENRENSRMRNAIKSIVKDLSSRLANPNKNRYVPEDLVQATIDMLESINLDTKEGNLIKEKVQKVKDAYERLGKSTNESDASDDYDPALYNMITRLKEIFDKGKSVRRLSQSELEDVLTIAKAIQTQIKNANELIKSEIAQKIDETARGVIEDVRANRKVGNGRLEDLGNRYLNTSLNAERYFKRLVGYNEDSKMMQLYDELNEGQHKMMQIQHEVSDIFKGVLENDAEARKLTGENAKDWVDTPFKDNNGNPLKIPAGMRLSLAMHMMNEDNLKHIIYGGLTVPDMKMYNQGRKAEAYSRPMAEIKFINNEQLKDIRSLRDAAVELNDEKYTNQEREDAWAKYKDAVNKAEDQAKAKLNEIIEGMTVYERQFLESAQKYFWDYSGKQINETSMALNGYPKAMVENYFPIATDKNYTKRDIEGLKMDQTLEGWGNLKSRVHGRNPIYLENILDVISKHSNMVSKYAGLAIPIRNFNKVYNFNLEGYKGSVKQVINTQRGKTATEYIENLMTDLQGSRKADTGIFGEALGKLRGNFAGGVLTVNPSVTIKQAASFPTAAAVLGWDAHNHVLLSKTGANLGLTLANPVHSMTKYTKDKMDLINQYSPLVWYRNQGNSTQELGDLKNQQTLLDKNKATKWLKSKTMNWIQNVDTTTVVALWDMAEYRVSKDTDLKKGTEEYYAEVAKWFNKAVEATQPNYTTLQRPDILRNPNEMLRNIMMFKTQPLQNLGILVDATGNLNAKTKAYKNNQTAENKAKLDEARRQFARAVSSQVVAAMVFSAMTLIAKALLHKMNPYRDDKGEITSESILEQYMKDLGSTLAGAAPGGAELYNFIMSKITGDRYYGLEVSTIEMINDLTTDLSSLYDSIKDEDADIDKIMKNAGKVIMDATGIAGIPLENIKKIYDAGKQHALDILNGEPLSFESGYKRSNTVNQGRLSEALLSGNEDKFEDVYDEMLDNGVEEKDINSYLNKTLADYESEDAVEILEGVGIDEDDAYDMLSDSIKSDVKQKVIDGEMSVDKAMSELEKIGYSEFDAYIQANTWEWKSDATSAVPYSGILVAIRSEDPEKIVDAVNMYLDNGYDKDTLKKYSGIKSNFADTYKELLQTNKTAAASLKNAMLTYFRACGKSDEDAMKQIDGWLE